MTVEQIVKEVFENLGEPSDLQYQDLAGVTDTASDGWHWFVDAINNACREIVTWKFPDGRVVRFRLLEAESPMKTYRESFNISSGSTSSQIVITDLTTQADNYYRGMLVEYGTDTNRVLGSRTNAGFTELFLIRLPAVNPVGTATISKREYYFLDSSAMAFGTLVNGIGYIPSEGRPIEIINIYDMETLESLTLNSKYDPAMAVDTTVGTPASYYKLAMGIRFDTWPDSERTYLVRYVRTPRVLDYVTTTAEPELPEHFHQAIALHVLWWGYKRMQENNSAYATKQDLTEKLRTLRTEYDLQDEFTNHSVTLTSSIGG